ncbi:nitrate/nitrite two-component system sensor histidine kinase [Idiomarina piscisalsi]|uniref:Sensor protein n=1 Tax=Idiomarina piscisalsi TaxID=1096243 RepID=A0ABN5AS52_9GAMM|nr:ATP-binding protein [Idiomarina piscisalsi]ASG66739.1 nitrate/nitrite two-component system sensor histidine kinase [Idiomarina piscisalsi]
MLRNASIINVFRVSLAIIAIAASASSLTAFWLLDSSTQNTKLINITDSIRINTYKFTTRLTNNQNEQAHSTAEKIQSLWEKYLSSTRSSGASEEFETHATKINQNWQSIIRDIQNKGFTQLSIDDLQRIDFYIDDLDQLVKMLQDNSEQRMGAVWVSLAFAPLVIVLMFFFLLTVLKLKIDEPLTHLLSVSKRLVRGDFTVKSQLNNNDKIGQLSCALNKIAETVSYFYGGLERRVKQQTEELSRKNKVLSFLYDTAHSIIENGYDYNNYQEAIERLYEVSEVDDIELCLLTEEGNRPFLQLQPRPNSHEPCEAGDCATCIKAGPGASVIEDKMVYRFVLKREDQNYGVLIVRCDPTEPLATWQQQLMSSTADQLALSQSLKSEEEQVRRLALMHERTVIARELHDSLAQALSYLKIQVTRLHKAVDKNDRDTIDDVSNELREGLNAAYRQLRELLTTFRLKVDGSGLYNALQTTVKQFSEQSDMAINLDYRLNNIPLAPHEEIHLLQIIREASQNAINHSEGTEVSITLSQPSGQDVELHIRDNGIGLPENTEKINHYGLAIMQERSRNLGGDIRLQRLESGGTEVFFTFTPDYLLQ